MKTRALTGFFFVAAMLASVLLGAYVFDAFYLLLPLFALAEFYRLVTIGGGTPRKTVGYVTAVVLYLVFAVSDGRYGLPSSVSLLPLLIPFVVLIFVQELYHRSESPFNNIAFTVFGIVYTVVPFIFYHALGYVGSQTGTATYNFHFPLAFLIMLWANDTGAYLSGYFLGRHKLFERHSPKKTWEGLIGGMVISALSAYILSFFYVDVSRSCWLILSLLISSFGTFGDLVESMFKRSINVKDSGFILPGHGGLLDRFDGLLLAAPVVFAYLHFVINL